jgi:lantibiotic modifying enzyme
VTIQKLAPAGFSHGAAGIAYSLLRLFSVTEDDRFREAALLGMAYEASLFSPDHVNWRDVRTDNPQLAYPNRWCHGAAGIGLARLAGQTFIGVGFSLGEIQSALDCTLNSAMTEVDPPCCGHFGPIDLLLEAGCRLNDHKLVDEARRRCALLIARARKRQGYALLPGRHEQSFSPGFFQGLSGVGYGLLRAADPDEVPSVLLFQG